MTAPILLGLGPSRHHVERGPRSWPFASWPPGSSRSGDRGPWWDSEALRAQLAYALPFGAALAVSVPQHSFHQWVVSAQFDPALFAIYTVGCFQLPIVDLLYTPTSEVLMVHVGELERGRPPA